jgi:C_GCAxxG_C_C family probable redox protein
MILEEENYHRMLEKATQLGYQYELNYFGCSQAVVAALIEAFGIGGPDILRASTTLAGGIARSGKGTCGALNGGLLMVGFLIGRDDLEMREQYLRAHEIAYSLYRRFEQTIGSAFCEDNQKRLYGRTFDMTTEEGREEFIAAGAHSPEGCATITRDGARLAAETIIEILKKGTPFARMLTIKK